MEKANYNHAKLRRLTRISKQEQKLSFENYV